MKEEPLVSIVMNCYNGQQYLREAIDSVIAQTYQNWELIFWDNQSNDSSSEIVKSYPDSRLKYFYAPSHTLLYEARNRAIEKAKGEFLAFLDVDDWWLPKKLERQIPLFADPQVGIACANFWIESERKSKRWISHKRPVPTGWVLNDLLKSYFVGMPTLMIRRSALASLEYPCDPRYHVIGDADLVIRLAVNWKLDCVHEPLAVYRLHANNETAKHRSRHISELELWLAEMEQVPAIYSCPDFLLFRNYVAYLKAMDQILEEDRKHAYSLFERLPWGQMKLRLCIALLLPVFIVRRLRNQG